MWMPNVELPMTDAYAKRAKKICLYVPMVCRETGNMVMQNRSLYSTTRYRITYRCNKTPKGTKYGGKICVDENPELDTWMKTEISNKHRCKKPAEDFTIFSSVTKPL